MNFEQWYDLFGDEKTKWLELHAQSTEVPDVIKSWDLPTHSVGKVVDWGKQQQCCGFQFLMGECKISSHTADPGHAYLHTAPAGWGPEVRKDALVSIGIEYLPKRS